MTGPLAYCQVDDIAATLQQLLDAGAETQQAIKNVGGGRLIASIKDADNNVTGLVQMS
jgi:predicted enzyme related to lactoylglutathione lyase